MKLAHALMILVCCAAARPAAAQVSKQTLPAEFRNDLIYLTPRLADGTALRIFTDSGGGFNAISAAIVAKQGWPIIRKLEEGGQTFQFVAFPAWDPQASFPPAMENSDLVSYDLEGIEPGLGGFLGNRWFAGKVLELDYRRQQLSLLNGWQPDAEQKKHRAALTFKARPGFHWPRIRIQVDGKPLEMLFDTGATLHLTESGGAAFNLPEGALIAGSFITKTRFDEWAARHPKWQVISGGDRLRTSQLPLIRVPEIEIAGLSIGPVWFAQRPDTNFIDGMSAMTDQTVEGALGGSALKFLKVVADYPGGAAYFSRP
jgi:hypothetical protein